MATNPEVLAPGQDEEEITSHPNSLSKIEEADRSHQIATARKYPRSVQKFVQDLTELACLSQPTAMAMIYSLPRANKQIVGPSVRFAEAVLACWGNARAGVEVVDVDRREGVVVSEGRYYDCEKNVGIALRKRRRIVAKTINADSIQITGDAGSSIAFRDVILRGVPKALWEPVWEKAKHTAAGDAKSIETVRRQLLEVFRALGITEVQIYNALSESSGHVVAGTADLGADEILALQAWHRQLKEGDCTLEDIFGSPLDEEIEQIMTSLGWSDTKKRMSRDNYKGRREELLQYVREQAKLAGKVPVEKVTPIKPEQKAEPAKPEPAKQDGDDLFTEEFVDEKGNKVPDPRQKPAAQHAEHKQPATTQQKRQGKIAW
jgi:hypothetical protein